MLNERSLDGNPYICYLPEKVSVELYDVNQARSGTAALLLELLSSKLVKQVFVDLSCRRLPHATVVSCHQEWTIAETDSKDRFTEDRDINTLSMARQWSFIHMSETPPIGKHLVEFTLSQPSIIKGTLGIILTVDTTW